MVAGAFTGQFKVVSSWEPGGWGVTSEKQTYSFGSGCAAGPACKLTKPTDGTSRALAAQGSGFGWSETVPVACTDNDTGALRTKHGFDYTYRVHLTPAATTSVGGVSYVSRIRATFTGTLKVNAEGRTFDCLVNPHRVPSETERAVGTFSLVPLAAPRPGVLSTTLGVKQPNASTTGTLGGFHLPESGRQLASAAAVSSGTVSSVPGALVTPSEAIRTVGDRLPQDLLLVAVLGLLIVFPAQLFNSTYEENHERIGRRLARLRRRRAAAPAPESSRVRRLAVFFACVVTGTLLAGFLDPKFGATHASYALVVGVFAAVLVAVLVSALAGRFFRSATHHAPDWYLRAIPSALLVAVVCVLVSRLTHFAPGYLYGVLGGAVFAAALDRRAAGRAETTVAVTGLGLALLAWVIFGPVARAVDGSDPSFWLLSADAFLAAVFIGGLEGLLFGLVPCASCPVRGSRTGAGWLGLR